MRGALALVGLVLRVGAQQASDGYYPSSGQQEMVQNPYGSPAFSPAPPQHGNTAQGQWAFMPRPLVYLKFNGNLDNSGTYGEMAVHPESWFPPFCGDNRGWGASGGACVDETGPWRGMELFAQNKFCDPDASSVLAHCDGCDGAGSCEQSRCSLTECFKLCDSDPGCTYLYVKSDTGRCKKLADCPGTTVLLSDGITTAVGNNIYKNPGVPALNTPIAPTFVNGTIGCEYTVDHSRMSKSRCRQALSNSLVRMNRNPHASRKSGSWSFWIFQPSGVGGQILYRNNAISINVATDGAIAFEIGVGQSDALSGSAHTIPASARTADVWEHIIFTWDGATGAVAGYVDGVEQVSATDAGLVGAMNDDSSTGHPSGVAYPTIGARPVGGRFAGHIDDMAFWPKAMNAEQAFSIFRCGVETSEAGTAVRAMGGGHPNNTLIPHTALTLAQYGYALCATRSGTIAEQGGWWPHITVRQGEGTSAHSVTQETDWQGPFPQQFKGEHYLDNPHLKYRNVHHPHQGALHQLRSKQISVGSANPYVQSSHVGTDWAITTGLNGENPQWPYELGNTGVDRSTIDVYHSAGVYVKANVTDYSYLGHPGNGGPLHCDLMKPGGGPPCDPYPFIGLEHSDPEVTANPTTHPGTYGYTTWSGGTQGLNAVPSANSPWDYTGWPDYQAMDLTKTTYAQAPVEGETGYPPTHTPHPTRQPEFYPTFGNHENGDSGELGSNEYPMSHLTDCMMHMSGSLALNTGTCSQPGYKLANGLHPGTYMMANN